MNIEIKQTIKLWTLWKKNVEFSSKLYQRRRYILKGEGKIFKFSRYSWAVRGTLKISACGPAPRSRYTVQFESTSRKRDQHIAVGGADSGFASLIALSSVRFWNFSFFFFSFSSLFFFFHLLIFLIIYSNCFPFLYSHRFFLYTGKILAAVSIVMYIKFWFMIDH